MPAEADADHRPRVGLIVPSSNTVVEQDFARELGSVASLHTARMYLAVTTEEAERRMLEVHVPRAIEDLATVRPMVVAFACTSAGAVLGEAGERELIQEIRGRTSATVISTNQAVKDVIGSYMPTAVAVVTPYVDGLTTRIRDGLESDGLQVIAAVGMGITDNFAIAEVSPTALVDYIRDRLRGLSFDLLFVSCTNLNAMAARAVLAEEFGIPVVTSNQATIERVRAALPPVAIPTTSAEGTSAP